MPCGIQSIAYYSQSLQVFELAPAYLLSAWPGLFGNGARISFCTALCVASPASAPAPRLGFFRVL